MTNGEFRASYDCVVVGAGPAGLAAASVAARAGLSVLLLDENAEPGGQIYRSVTTTPVTRPGILGPDYHHGRHLVTEARESGAELAGGATVWSLDSRLELGVSRSGAARMIGARHVILATGALERPFPIPGWTLPGVMTAGAAQGLLKSSGLVPDGRVVLAGLGPLVWLLAAQLLRAGGHIEAILDTTPRGRLAANALHLPGFLLSPLAAKGLALTREVKRRVRVIRGVGTIEAVGDLKLREVRYTAAGGVPERLAADHLLLHQGVVPNVNLAMAAGIAHRWDPVQLCFLPVLGPSGETSVDGISIAGDGAGIAGAWAAEERGRLAGIAAVRRLAPGQECPDDQLVRQRLRRHMLGRSFLDRLFQPPAAFRLPEGDTIVCRCEEVTAANIRETAALGVEGPNQMKAFLRSGMGPCQGRLCGLTVTELIAAHRGVTPDAVGYYRLRPPVKPLALSELAAMPADAAAVKAVVRG